LKKKQNDSISLLWSIGYGVVAVLAASVIAAFITSKLTNPVRYIEYGAILSALASGIVCGIVCSRKISQSIFTYSLMAGGSIALLLFIISLLGGNGGSTLTRFGVPLAIVIGSIIPPVLFRSNNDSKKKLKQIKRKYS